MPVKGPSLHQTASKCVLASHVADFLSSTQAHTSSTQSNTGHTPDEVLLCVACARRLWLPAPIEGLQPSGGNINSVGHPTAANKARPCGITPPLSGRRSAVTGSLCHALFRMARCFFWQEAIACLTPPTNPRAVVPPSPDCHRMKLWWDNILSLSGERPLRAGSATPHSVGWSAVPADARARRHSPLTLLAARALPTLPRHFEQSLHASGSSGPACVFLSCNGGVKSLR